MRAYQIGKNGPWVDLDTIIRIDPPICDYSLKSAVMLWYHAGYNEPMRAVKAFPPEMIVFIETEMTEKVFTPFLSAWIGN